MSKKSNLKHGASIWDTAARRIVADSVRIQNGKLKYHPTLIAAIARANPLEVVRILNPKLRFENNDILPTALKYKDLHTLEATYGELIAHPVKFAMALYKPEASTELKRSNVLSILGEHFKSLCEECERLDLPVIPKIEDIFEFGKQYPQALNTFKLGLKLSGQQNITDNNQDNPSAAPSA